MCIELKIKLKTLAYEAKEIRKAEAALFRAGHRLQKEHLTWKAAELHAHRVCIVRKAARSTNVAYGYLRGRSYESIEGKAKTPPNWKEVYRMVTTYGRNTISTKGDFCRWAGIDIHRL